MFHSIQVLHFLKKHCIARDLKLDNFLISKNVIKVANFGMAREIVPNKRYTSNVATI